jgi:small subunit ribosomal protein S2
MARAAAAANAGRDEKPEAGAPGSDEPLPEWEQALYQPSGGATSEAPAATEAVLTEPVGESIGATAEAAIEAEVQPSA